MEKGIVASDLESEQVSLRDVLRAFHCDPNARISAVFGRHAFTTSLLVLASTAELIYSETQIQIINSFLSPVCTDVRKAIREIYISVDSAYSDNDEFGGDFIVLDLNFGQWVTLGLLVEFMLISFQVFLIALNKVGFQVGHENVTTSFPPEAIQQSLIEASDSYVKAAFEIAAQLTRTMSH